VPCGAVIDATRHRRFALSLATLGLGLSALLMAAVPVLASVLLSQALHSLATAVSLPAIAALTLALVGRRELGERMGRNARWSSIGNGVAAALMGWIGYSVSYRAVFVFTALLSLPALFSLLFLPSGPPLEHHRQHRANRAPLAEMLADHRLFIFTVCAFFFQLSNAALLQLVGGELTAGIGTGANLVIAAAIVIPQVVVAALSPLAGRLATRLGRKRILALGFAALPLRAAAFALTANPALVLFLQILDGVAGTVSGVLTPLIVADIAGDKGRFNVTMGMAGLAGGVGATLSTSLAGIIADRDGTALAFLALAAAGLAATLTAHFVMPETAPEALAGGEAPPARA
jgi:MFS family permease